MKATSDIKHPSFGMLEITRTHGGNQHLFGSSIKHDHSIQLRISEAVLRRDLNCDRVYPERSLIEVNMSAVQFAEAITSLNSSGTPCTITWKDGNVVEATPFIPQRELFEREFTESMESLADRTAALSEAARALLSSSTPLKMSEKASILHEIKMIHQDISANIPFVRDQFNVQMNKTVLDAKAEVEAFIDTKIRSLGITALKEEFSGKLLPEETTGNDAAPSV